MPAASIARLWSTSRAASALALFIAGAFGFADGPASSIVDGPLNPAGGADATENAIVPPRHDHAAVGITIDGRLDEDIWSRVPAYDHMLVTTPDVRRPARYRTQTFLLYTQRGLYVGAWNEQPSDTLMGPLSGRDSFEYADAYQIVVDSSGAGLYGYWFRVKLGDSLMDGTLLPERRFARDWDGPWDARTERTDAGWTVEMFLPWSMMNMPAGDGERRIAIEIARFVPHLNEVWSWPALPDTEPQFISLFQPLTLAGVAPRQEVSVFPYAAVSDDLVRGTGATDAGVDVFWRPSSAFFLSAGINPDFGQVEADNVVVNLSAYETFFPEKRLFFQENQDIFSTGEYGYGNAASPLHTRRMGASVGSRRGRPDLGDERVEGHDLTRPVDLRIAAKAVGQAGRSRYGTMLVAEDDTQLRRADGNGHVTARGRDFSVLRYQYEDTSAGARKAIGWLGTLAQHPERRAITQAVDANYRTPSGDWSVEAQVLGSDVDGQEGWGGILDVVNVPRTGDQHFFHIASFDDGLDLNDLGYLWRNDYTRVFYEFWRRRQEYDRIRDTEGWAYFHADVNGAGQLVEGVAELHYGWGFKNNTRISVEVEYYPSYWDDRASRGNGTFRLGRAWDVLANWNSAPDGKFNVGIGLDFGRESLGGTSREADVFLTYSPLDRIRLRLSTGYQSRESWLVWQGGANLTSFASEHWFTSMSAEAYFTARQHLQVQIQWAAVKAFESERFSVNGETWLDRMQRPPEAEPDAFAISDVVLQLRYRWQIAPLSDLFIVYNRTGSLPDGVGRQRFTRLFDDSFGTPDEEGLLLKVRYRFGT